MLYKSLGERNFPKQKKKNFFTHCKERKKERKKETIKEQNKQKKKIYGIATNATLQNREITYVQMVYGLIGYVQNNENYSCREYKNY